MKNKIQTALAHALIPAALVVSVSCSSEPKAESTSQAGPAGQGAVMVAAKQGVPGGVLVGTYQETATVTAVDKEKRKITLAAADGSQAVFKAGPDVVNFDQIQVGDHVKATVTQQLVVYVRKNGEPSTDGAATTVALAPVGAKPGAFVADTVEITAKVTEIDLKHHTATLQFPDGSKKSFDVRPDVDLANQSVGQDVVIRTTEALAISVQKP
jgi:hypothetical protein